ncbi:LOW QUALITY PROTEIN: conserved oligomeric Golgi complex subunit 8-like [Amazona ochrocephala]
MEEIEQLCALPGLSEDPSVVGLLKVEEQQVAIATTPVHQWPYRTNRDSLIPIHKLICRLESQGVISRTCSPFNSPMRPVRKSNGVWRPTVDYCGLNEVTPPLSAAVPDILELQYELESKAAKWYARIDIANAFFSIPLAAECRPQIAGHVLSFLCLQSSNTKSPSVNTALHQLLRRKLTATAEPRTDIFMEAELHIKLLQPWDSWLRSIQVSIPDDDPYFHITKAIEACHIHLFDIITQQVAAPAFQGQALNQKAIFHGWVLQKVSKFLQTLECNLCCRVGSSLDSLLGQCMNFGLSFSRVGANFCGQLATLFQHVATATFRKVVEEAVEKFREEMNSYMLISALTVLGGSAGGLVPTAQPGMLQPPMVLLDFLPLTCFLNDLLVAFSDLWLCCPVALAQDVTTCLEDMLGYVQGGGAVPCPGRIRGQACPALNIHSIEL